MGLASSKERPPLNCLMTGTVGAEPLRLLLESAGLSRVTVTQPASQSTACQSDGSAFGASVGSSMMVLPTDDAELYLLNVERHGIRIDGYSLLAPAPPDSATLEGFLDRQALLFIVDAAPNATPAATLATEKERLHGLLGSMSGRPPLAVVIVLNSKQVRVLALHLRMLRTVHAWDDVCVHVGSKVKRHHEVFNSSKTIKIV
jgi:hypothetical protein